MLDCGELLLAWIFLIFRMPGAVNGAELACRLSPEESPPQLCARIIKTDQRRTPPNIVRPKLFSPLAQIGQRQCIEKTIYRVQS